MLRAFRSLIGAAICILQGIGSFFDNQWRQYEPLGQLLFLIAVSAIVVDATIAFEYGRSMSVWHGAGLAMVALAFCLLPDVATKAWGEGRKAAGVWLGIACVPLGMVAYQSHIGYTSGLRLGDMQQTGFQHTVLEAQQLSLKSEGENIGMWRQQLADQKKRNAEIQARNSGWSVTTKPEALRAQMAAIDQAIANEAKRVRCGDKCEGLKKQKADVLALIEGVEAENGLAERIKATQAVIDAKAAKVAETGYHSSTVVNQNDTFSTLWNLVAVASGRSTMTPEQAIEPTAVQRRVTNTATAGAVSLGLMIAGPVLWLSAGLNRRKGLDIYPPLPTEAAAVSAPAASHDRADPVAATMPVPASLVDVRARRAKVQETLRGMRQSRVDGRLLAAS